MQEEVAWDAGRAQMSPEEGPGDIGREKHVRRTLFLSPKDSGTLQAWEPM